MTITTKTGRLVTPQPPRLPDATKDYDARYIDQLNNILRLYFNQLQNFNQAFVSNTGGALLQFPSGSFQDNTTQQPSVNYPTPLSFSQVDYSNQIVLTDTTASFTGARTGTTLTVSAITGQLYVGSHLFGTGYETAVVTASITANVMNVTAVTSGTMVVGDYLTGTGIPTGARVASFLTGSGGTGTYQINLPDGTSITVASTTVTGYGVYIVDQLTGTAGAAGTYTTSTSGALSSRAMTSRVTSRMTALVAGTYNFQWSGQFSNLDNATQDAYVWLRINGADLVGSTGKLSLLARKSAGVPSTNIIGWNYYVNLNANDYLEIFAVVTNSALTIATYPKATGTPLAYPSTASVVATLGFVSALYP
jgi:hypothetical protein